MSEHTCESVVVHCIDFRFRKRLNEYLMGRFPDGYDLIASAGAVKRLLANGGENNSAMDDLEISHRLHDPKLIVLIQHEDCGAYGGTKAFESAEMEKEFQKDELQKTAELLKKKFPDLEVECLFARLSGDVDIIVPAVRV